MRFRSARRLAVLACSTILVAAVLVPWAVVAPPASADGGATGPQDLTRLVNPFVNVRHPRVTPHTPITGTSANGNTFPGADVPFGMLQWSPDTSSNAPGGYSYADHTITGFSLTHLSGAGCRIFGDIPFLPTGARLGASPANGLWPYDSSFSHSSEQAAPGSYGVTLARWGIGVRLTTATRAGIGEFAYPANVPAHLMIDAGKDANGTRGSAVTIVGSNEVTGSASSGSFCGHPGAYAVHFAVVFDHPFVTWSVWNGSRVAHGGRTASGPHTGAFLSFGTHTTRTTVLAKVGISFVGPANALGNLRAAIPGWSFDTVQTSATDAWNAALNKIQVTGGTDAERDTFYTALYHSLLFPSVFNDANGQYVGMDGRVHVVAGHLQYSNISGWDVYRSEVPLLALLFPQRASDIVRSLLNDAAQSRGWLPKWPVARMTPGVMDGDSADPIIAGAYAFGARDFPANAALSRMVADATHTGEGPYGYVERPGLASYLQHGYVAYSPSSLDLASSAATTLEYCTDDFAIARLAAALGSQSVSTTFMHRAQNWQRLFNPATGFVQPRRPDGSFDPGFGPGSETGFREGDGWQYAWMVPHDLAALVRAMGGADSAVGRLQTFFASLRGGRAAPSYQSANEVDVEAPWEFDFAGAPWQTQDVVRRIVTTVYTDGPSGLPGNDDLGALSSWYVWAAMGLYPEIPGVAGLAVGSPLFPEIDLTLAGGVTRILAPNAADDAPFVTGLSVDDVPVSAPWIPLSDVADGATVAFDLSSTPDAGWGTSATPPSFGAGEAPGISLTTPSGAVKVARGGTTTVGVGVRGVVDADVSVAWTVSVASGSGLRVTPGAGPLSLDPGAEQQTQIAVAASSSARSGTVVLRAQATVPGSEPIWLAPVVVRVTVD